MRRSTELRGLRGIAAGVGLIVVACHHVERDELDDLVQERRSIAVGAEDSSTPVRDAVVKVIASGEFCTGTLVGPDKVLTAAHCGFDDPSLADGNWRLHQPGNIAIGFGPVTATNTATANGNFVTVPRHATGGPWDLDDIALIQLDNMVPRETAVHRTMHLDPPEGLSALSPLFGIGFGGPVSRNRRIMTASGYRDWLTDPAGRINAFNYVPTDLDVGDRGTNVEAGDSGGPILMPGVTSPVLGVHSWWTPTGIATFGPGGGGRPSIQNWLRDQILAEPEVGWVWAHSLSDMSYRADTAFSHHPLGDVTISQLMAGRTQVLLANVGRLLAPAALHVTAYGSDANWCKLLKADAEDTGRPIDYVLAYVECFTPAGVSVRSRFVLSYVRQHFAPGPGQANLVTKSGGTAIWRQWNSTRWGLQLVRLGTGRYQVTLPGQTSLVGSTVTVTALGNNPIRCKVESWALVTDVVATVACHDPTGQLADGDFHFSFLAGRTAHNGPGGHAFIDNLSAPLFAPPTPSRHHSEGGDVTAGNNPDGSQWVDFDGLPGAAGGLPHVTALGAGPEYCKVASWGSRVNVRCFDATGRLTPSRYTASYMVHGTTVAHLAATGEICPVGPTAGDAELGGAPRIRVAAELRVSDDRTRILADIDFGAREVGGDSEVVHQRNGIEVWRAPEGRTIRTIATPTRSVVFAQGSDAGYESPGLCSEGALIPPSGVRIRGPLVSGIELIGDTGGDDISRDTDCTCDTKIRNITFNDAVVALR